MTIKRRALLGWGAAALGAGRSAAQSSQRRIGVLTPSAQQYEEAAFLDELRAQGFEAGRNLSVLVRSADGQLPRLPALAEELAQARVDAMVGVNTPGARTAIASGFRGPIVAAVVGDPVALGLVTSLARPDRNVTGISNQTLDILRKRLALLLEAAPAIRRVAALYHPEDPIAAPQREQMTTDADLLRVAVQTVPVRGPEDLAPGLEAALAWGAQGVLRLAGQGQTVGPATGRIATELGLPAMLLDKPSVEAGGLMAYFADYEHLWRRAASLVGRILQGASPRDLPFEQPTKFQLVLNVRSASALGLRLPTTLLALADEVIE